MIRRRRSVVVIAVASAFAGPLAWAATMRSLDVDKKDARYSLVADTFLAADADAIYAVLIDYENMNRISSVYKEYGYLEPDADGTPIVFTRMEGCALFYCKSMRRVERLEMEPPYYIRTEALPEQSDFKFAVSEWLLAPEGDGTHVVYKLELEPDFWVPPIVGPWYLKRTLMRGGSRAIQRIENIANAPPEPETLAQDVEPHRP
jgi:hypothetical protein